MMKAALFGGSFNPIHVGHLIVAEAALDALRVDSVVFVPSGAPPHKPAQALAPAAHRLRMAQLAVADNPRLEVWDHEIRTEEVSYTIDTVRVWKRRNGLQGPAAFLIGADTVGELETWRSVDELFEECEFVPFARPGSGLDTPPRLAAKVGEPAILAMLARTVRIPLVDVSASTIRRLVAARKSIRYLTPDPVTAYIKAHGLYREKDATERRPQTAADGAAGCCAAHPV